MSGMAIAASSPEDRAREIFIYAESFSHASETLAKIARNGEEGKQFKSLSLHAASPVITVDSFALELYLKCLHWIDRKKEPTKLHKYVELFEALSPDAQKSIAVWYQQILKQNDATVRQHARDFPKFDYSLKNWLQLSNNTFTRIRYAFEGKTGDIIYWPFLRVAVRNVIVSSAPGWSWIKNK